MAWGLPKLPGFTFRDPTKTQFQICPSLRLNQGHMFPDLIVKGSGGDPTDVDSNAFSLPEDVINYDPSLTYGRVKQPALPAVIPHFVHYDKKCLKFGAFFKQSVYNNPEEKYRIRYVNIIYFLEDDTMSVMEPRVPNSGIWQGKMVQRGHIPKNDRGDCWHWKDLNVGKDICIFGKVFHTVNCDLFTKEWMESMGIVIAKEEDMPTDAYNEKEKWKWTPAPQKKVMKVDTLRRFLEYDGKVLAYDVVWDDRDGDDYKDLTPYKLFYFLQDDTIAIKELHDGKGGKDPFPLLLKKTKIPKKWKEKPVTFPSSVLEVSDEEVVEYYSPLDLIIGETIFVYGRRMLLVDCDPFTRKYFKVMLNVDQPPRVHIPERPKPEFKQVLPPHIGIGTPEDSLGSCFGLIPKVPKKDVVRYSLNAAKYLRYLCELDWIHPEDKGREFVLAYNLGDGKIKIGEIPKRNSGFKAGKFLTSTRLQTPDSDPNFPTYVTPEKFYIGATVHVFKHRFKITGCDLFVYRYMCANPEKFPPEVIDNVRNYHLREGNLKDDLEEAVREEQAAVTQAELAKIGQVTVAPPSPEEECLRALNVADDSGKLASPPPASPTTDRVSYDDSVRFARQSKPPCQGVMPLKGILKSGAAKEDHQKVVCFSGPATDAQPQKKPQAPTKPGGLIEDEDYCERFRRPGELEAKERRARNVCAYEVIKTGENKYESLDEPPEPPPPGFLGKYGVDCSAVPDYMRVTAEDYDRVKSQRRDVPQVSPAVAEMAKYPLLPVQPAAACLTSAGARPDDQCAKPIPEDVAFACDHVEPRIPCCVPDEEKQNTVTKL